MYGAFTTLSPSPDGTPDTHNEEKSRQSSGSGNQFCTKSTIMAECSHPKRSYPMSLSTPTTSKSASVSSLPKMSNAFVVAGIGTLSAGKGTGDAAPVTDAEGGVYSDNTCSVCLDEYEEGDELLQLTCGHVFHRSCIDVWLKKNSICPYCRWVLPIFFK